MKIIKTIKLFAIKVWDGIVSLNLYVKIFLIGFILLTIAGLIKEHLR
jgi:hypothetical protein